MDYSIILMYTLMSCFFSRSNLMRPRCSRLRIYDTASHNCRKDRTPSHKHVFVVLAQNDASSFQWMVSFWPKTRSLELIRRVLSKNVLENAPYQIILWTCLPKGWRMCASFWRFFSGILQVLKPDLHSCLSGPDVFNQTNQTFLPGQYIGLYVISG